MIETLKRSEPVARKAHKCMFCGCSIESGTRYLRETLKCDGILYEWVSHHECTELVDKLDMMEYADDGVGMELWQDTVSEYMHSTYEDAATDDLREDLQHLSYYEWGKKILADWDTPEIAVPRLKEELKSAEKWFKLSGTRYQESRIQNIKKKLEEYEQRENDNAD